MTGVRFSPQTLRSDICCDHLRNGRNLFYLAKNLGHSSVTTTRKYFQSVGVDDLQALHDTLSPLVPKRGTIKESCDRSGPVASTALFGLCRDIKDLTIHQNSVPAKELLDLVADYATDEDNALDKKGK